MSRPSNRTSPSTRAPGIVSCIRLRQRSSVDLPQPDGPMMDVTSPDWTPNDTSRTTRDAPKYASSDSAATHAGAAASGTGTSRSIAAAESEARPRDESGRDADDEDESEEDERSSPGLCVLVFIGRDGIGVDLHRQRGDRLAQGDGPELITERGEQERRRFTGDARDGDERASHDAGERGPQDH